MSEVPFRCQKLLPSSEIPDNAIPVVIAACGSYNPIHSGHLAMFEEARESLERGTSTFNVFPEGSQVKVVGGFLSPVNDAYGKADLALFAARLQLCELAVADSNWISVDPWEGLQLENQRSYVVLSRIGKAVHDHYASEAEAMEGHHAAHRIHVVFLCGADLFESFYKPGVWKLSLLERIFAEMLVVAVCRDGSKDPRETMATAPPLTHKDEPGVSLDMARFQGRVGIIRALSDKCASSTLVRRLLREGADVSDLVPPACVTFLPKVYAS